MLTQLDAPRALNGLGEHFAADGFVGPVPLLTRAECDALLKHLSDDRRPEPATWPKGAAASDWVLARLGSDPRLLRLLIPLLGQDIVLWGCSLVQRAPGDIHPWHVDIETAADDGRFVTVWIGLENTSGSSGLSMVAGSHLCGRTIQQVRADKGAPREAFNPDEVAGWAQELNPAARIAEPELGDGDAILFDGRMWHGSHNRDPERTRSALLLQFAAADMPVRMANLHFVDWPFQLLDDPRPPVVAVSGTPRPDVNLVVSPPRPPAKAVPRLECFVRELAFPLAGDAERGWHPHPLFLGSTSQLASLSCHAAVLNPGHSPHAPHSHHDEELLIVLDGEAELLVADRPDYHGARPVPVKAGDFAYYPALRHHTIRNSSRRPVTYMMYRWRSRRAVAAPALLQASVFRSPPQPEADAPFAVRTVLDAPTGWLRKLHCHTSIVEPGGGYAAHVDDYDVGLIVQSGRIETLGREVGPGGLVFYPAGELHGMRNPGSEPARYIVFEFHGRGVAA